MRSIRAEMSVARIRTPRASQEGTASRATMASVYASSPEEHPALQKLMGRPRAASSGSTASLRNAKCCDSRKNAVLFVVSASTSSDSSRPVVSRSRYSRYTSKSLNPRVRTRRARRVCTIFSFPSAMVIPATWWTSPRIASNCSRVSSGSFRIPIVSERLEDFIVVVERDQSRTEALSCTPPGPVGPGRGDVAVRGSDQGFDGRRRRIGLHVPSPVAVGQTELHDHVLHAGGLAAQFLCRPRALLAARRGLLCDAVHLLDRAVDR